MKPKTTEAFKRIGSFLTAMTLIVAHFSFTTRLNNVDAAGTSTQLNEWDFMHEAKFKNTNGDEITPTLREIQPDDGDVTISMDNPYIQNVADFLAFAKNPENYIKDYGTTITLENNLDFGCTPLTPVPGTAKNPSGFYFQADSDKVTYMKPIKLSAVQKSDFIFDGQGHTLSGLTIYSPRADNVTSVGLFDGLLDAEVCQNLHLNTECTVIADFPDDDNSPRYCGGITGKSRVTGSVRMCGSSARVFAAMSKDKGNVGPVLVGGVCGDGMLSEVVFLMGIFTPVGLSA